MFVCFSFLQIALHRHKILARFGLMHLLASNLCSWLYTLIQEANHAVHQAKLTTHAAEGEAADSPKLGHGAVSQKLRGHACPWESSMLHDLLHRSSPFLFPCTIEYSLICGAVVFVMWKDLDKQCLSNATAKQKKVESSLISSKWRSLFPADETSEQEASNFLL